MKFTKMHGLGNDYVYVNGFEQTIADPAAVARKVSDRHTGIGGDGLVLILPSQKADVRMRMFNADGSEAEMCGNAIRCVAKYAHERGLAKINPMRIETGRGVLTLDLKLSGADVDLVTVNMGAPIIEPADVPVDPKRMRRSGEHQYEVPLDHPKRAMFEWPGEFVATFVSMGNPHAVLYVADPGRIEAEHLGPIIEHHPAFPRRINVHWVGVISPTEVRMRTWERGSGITMACGTGACAVCVAGVLTGRTQRKLLAHLPGGDLQLEWRESDNCVYMTGPATEVFSGEWNG